MTAHIHLSPIIAFWVPGTVSPRLHVPLYQIWLDEAETNSYFLTLIGILWTRNWTATVFSFHQIILPVRFTLTRSSFHYFGLFMKKKKFPTNFTAQWFIHYAILFLSLLKLKMHMPCCATLLYSRVGLKKVSKWN